MTWSFAGESWKYAWDKNVAEFEHFQFEELLFSAKYEKNFSKNQITVSFVSLFFLHHIIKQSEIELELQALS